MYGNIFINGKTYIFMKNEKKVLKNKNIFSKTQILFAINSNFLRYVQLINTSCHPTTRKILYEIRKNRNKTGSRPVRSVLVKFLKYRNSCSLTGFCMADSKLLVRLIIIISIHKQLK